MIHEVIRCLFEDFMRPPELLPEDVQKNIIRQGSERGKAKVIADCITGMTV